MSRKIPPYITDPKVRKYLAELNQHLETLEKAHKGLMSELKKNKTWTKEQKELRTKIVKAHENLSKQYKQLAPTLAEIFIEMAHKNKK